MSRAQSRAEVEPYAGPVTPWPRAIPARINPPQRDELFIMTLGEVRTPLADGVFDPLADRLTLTDGTVIEDYYKQRLEIPFYEPLDKSAFPLPPSGWCSWYYYYQEITADEVLANARWIAEHLKEYGARYVQIDDGWQGTGHGGGENRDWTTIDKRFRKLGMDGLAAEIRKVGLEAGIWLCPHGQSNETVVRDSGAFLLKPDGSSASDTWEGKFLVDPSSAKGHAYLHDLFTMLRRWGYTYFKIDGQPIVLGEYPKLSEFMAGGKFPKSEEPDELYRHTLRTIRAAIGPESYLLGCWGVPLPGVGIMHGSRTGGDIIQGWDGFLIANDAVQRWNFLHNIAWYCDPDVCMVRPPVRESTARCWVTLQGLTGQALLTSDRLPDLPPARVELLRRIYPAVDIRPLDLFKPERTRKPIWVLKVNQPLEQARTCDVVGVCNYDTEKAVTFHLAWEQLGSDADQPRHVYDFWQRTYLGAWEDGIFIEVPPGDARVITLVPAAQRPVLVSTSRHITQGWVDLLELESGGTDDAPRLKGASRVIGGDPYTLTIGLPRSAPTWSLAKAVAKGVRQKNVNVSFLSHQGCATVTVESGITQDVSWELTFSPAHLYESPLTPPRELDVKQIGLTEAAVSWPSNYYTAAGFRVSLDGKPLGVALQPRAVLRDLEPGRSYVVGARSLRSDGSASEGIAEVDFAPVVPDVLYLSDLDPQTATQDWGSLHHDRSVDGNPLTVGGERAEKGLGTHADSQLVYRVHGQFARFEARVGVDDEANPPSPVEVVFELWGDGERLWESEPVKSQQAPLPVGVDIHGVELLELRVLRGGDGMNYDHADWLEARVIRQAQR